MPFYRYECMECKGTFKVLQQNGDRDPAVCPACGSKRTRRLLPRIGVVYKGSGYYSTDYRRKRTKAAEGNGGKGKEPAATVSEAEG